MNPEALALFKLAIDMYQAQYSATDRLWGYFSAVSLAVVAYTISSEKVTRVFPQAVTVVVAYLVFCVGNFGALSMAQRQLVVIAEVVRAHGKLAGIDAAAFQPYSVAQVQGFYIAVVSTICLATLLLAWHRGRHPAAPAGPAR